MVFQNGTSVSISLEIINILISIQDLLFLFFYFVYNLKQNYIQQLFYQYSKFYNNVYNFYIYLFQIHLSLKGILIFYKVEKYLFKLFRYKVIFV